MQYRETMKRALRGSIRMATDSEKTMHVVAVALRAGEQVAMFASGEDGARAADGIAAEHAAFAADCRHALDALDDLEADRYKALCDAVSALCDEYTLKAENSYDEALITQVRAMLAARE